MKNIITTILLLFVFQLGFSQTEKMLRGKISGDDLPVQSVDVINYTNQKSTQTNSSGVFFILARANDVILVHHKNYVDQKIILTKKDIDNESFDIILAVKPTQLEEVIVDKGTVLKFNLTPADFDGAKIERAAAQPKVVGINDGTIPNGMDLIRIGKGAYQLMKTLFKSNDKESNRTVAFREYVASNIKKDFYIRNLRLQVNEIPLFLNFCNEDPKTKELSNPNILSVMDFLFAKNIEFQKLLTLVK